MIQPACQAICACCGRRCSLPVDGHTTHVRAGGHKFTRLALASETYFPRAAALDTAAQQRTDPGLEGGTSAFEWQRIQRKNRYKREKRAAKAGQP